MAENARLNPLTPHRTGFLLQRHLKFLLLWTLLLYPHPHHPPLSPHPHQL